MSIYLYILSPYFCLCVNLDEILPELEAGEVVEETKVLWKDGEGHVVQAQHGQRLKINMILRSLKLSVCLCICMSACMYFHQSTIMTY